MHLFGINGLIPPPPSNLGDKVSDKVSAENHPLLLGGPYEGSVLKRIRKTFKFSEKTTLGKRMVENAS